MNTIAKNLIFFINLYFFILYKTYHIPFTCKKQVCTKPVDAPSQPFFSKQLQI